MSRLPILMAMFVALMTAGGCGSVAGSDPVAAVIGNLERGDRHGAQVAVDRLLADTAAFDALTAGQLCRLSRALVRLSSPSEVEANDASAARCLSRARSLAPDTVERFLQTVSGDDAARLAVLDRVGSYLGIPRDSLAIAEEDSIYHRQP